MSTLKKIKKLIKEKRINEEGIAAGPVNVVGTGAIAGTGGKGGEPGVHPSDQPGFKKRKSDFPKPKSPVMSGLRRKPPKI